MPCRLIESEGYALETICRTARARERVLVADPEILQAGHARRRLDLRRQCAHGVDPPGRRRGAGGQRRVSAGNSASQPGDARHPLGLRILHRRRLRDRPGRRGRDLARRRRLRHQLRRAAHAEQSERDRRSAGNRDARPRTLSLCTDGGRPRGQVQVRPPRAAALARAGTAVPARTRAGDRARSRIHGGPRLSGRRPPRFRQRPRPRSGVRPVRHARLGQPLPGGAGGRPRV